MMHIDLTMSNPNKHRIICTDFGATFDLGATEKGNCSVDNHSVMCIFFVVSKWREVEYYNTESNLDKTIINNCDKWIFFGHKISKGKKKIMYFTILALTIFSPITIKRGKEMVLIRFQ